MNKLHVELVDNAQDSTNKQNNFFMVNNMAIDLCDKNNWICIGNAFALLIPINNHPGHASPLHITIGYFGQGNCSTALQEARDIVAKIIGKQLH